MAKRLDSVFFYKDEAGEWRWSRTDAYNGNIVSESGEGYHNREDCINIAQKQFMDTVYYYDRESGKEVPVQ